MNYRLTDASADVGHMEDAADELNIAKEMNVYDAQHAEQMEMTAVLGDLVLDRCTDCRSTWFTSDGLREYQKKSGTITVIHMTCNKDKLAR